MILKKINIYILFIFLAAFFLESSTTKRKNSPLKEKVEEYMGRSVETGFTGSLLVAKGGKLILSKGYGLADKRNNIPITSQTVFTTGSITKQFTAAAILKLQMMGKLKVNDLMSKYFPDVPDDKKNITLHHLLTHTAGFPGAIGNDFDPVSAEEFLKLAMKTRLKRKPGDEYEYSNVGYSLLGIIVEKVSGKGYERFLRDYLFIPAGMKKTGYLLPKWKKEDLAHGYRGKKDWGTLRDHPWCKDGPGWHLRGNGGIMSTLGEMYKWHLALLGNKILNKEAKKVLYKPHVREGRDAPSFYGYGWAIFKTSRNTRLIAHNGGNMVFAADFQRFLDEDVVIIAFSNTAGKPAFRISEIVARIVFNEPYSLPLKEPIKLSPEEMKKSSGESDWGLPHSTTGQKASIILDILYKTGTEFTEEAVNKSFNRTFIKKGSLEDFLKKIQKYKAEIGEFRLLGAMKTGPFSARLKIQSKKTQKFYMVKFQLEEQTPNLISELNIEEEE